jgi:hypothetical protein
VSKERAKRRAEREAARAVAEAARLKRERRRAGRRALLRRVTPRPGRRAWLLGRRSPAQRSAILGAGVAGLLAIWYFFEPLGLRIAFSLLFLLLLPVLAVIAFDRRV